MGHVIDLNAVRLLLLRDIHWKKHCATSSTRRIDKKFFHIILPPPPRMLISYFLQFLFLLVFVSDNEVRWSKKERKKFEERRGVTFLLLKSSISSFTVKMRREREKEDTRPYISETSRRLKINLTFRHGRNSPLYRMWQIKKCGRFLYMMGWHFL